MAGSKPPRDPAAIAWMRQARRTVGPEHLTRRTSPAHRSDHSAGRGVGPRADLDGRQPDRAPIVVLVAHLVGIVPLVDAYVFAMALAAFLERAVEVGDAVAVLTYDERLAQASRAVGLGVAAPM